MSVKKLWAVSSRGNVYTLSLNQREWQQVANQNVSLQGFKKVAATAGSIWGLGCDHQVYLYVPASDVPIRCQQATHENERWIPSLGWSADHLLPAVDPWKWSSEDGSRHLPKEDFKLPSEHWQWESDWTVDENVHGYLTDKGGWRYAAFDFNHDFTHRKRINSCVRRRRWIRYYRYMANDKWARIPSVHVDPLEEPITDVAVGGQDIPFQPAGYLTVCAITINGRLLYRTGVSRQCPEGSSWNQLDLIDDLEALSVSIGPRGLFWVVTWGGHLLVRTGVSQENILGTGWARVENPDPEDRISQISVGLNAVWAITTMGNVWFRKGVVSLQAGENESAATGTGWVGMVHQMRAIAVGPNDQVWGVTYHECQLYFRTGVTDDEQTGRNWSLVDLPYHSQHKSNQRSRHNSGRSDTSGYSDTSNRSCTTMRSDASFTDLSVSSPPTRSNNNPSSSNHSSVLSDLDSCASSRQNLSDISVGDQKNTVIKTGVTDGSENQLKVSNNGHKAKHKKPSPVVRTKTNHSSNIASTNSTSSQSLSSQGDSGTSSKPKMTASLSSDFKVMFRMTRGDENTEDPDGGLLSLGLDDVSFADSEPSLEIEDEEEDLFLDDIWTQDLVESAEISWVWVSPMACPVTREADVQSWIMPESGEQRILTRHYQFSAGPRRGEILSQLRRRNQLKVDVKQYELAVDRACWSKKGKGQWWQDLHRGPKWLKTQVEMTQDVDPLLRDGSLVLQYTYGGAEKYLQIQLDDILSCVWINDTSIIVPVMAIQTQPRIQHTPREPPHRLAFSTEQELEEWLVALTVACCNQRRLYGRPHLASAWATTDRGDIFVHEPEPEMISELSSEMFWHQVGGHLSKIETNISGVTWGIGHDGLPWVFTGGYGGGFFKGVSSSPQGINQQVDMREVHIYENQRWRPVIGYSDRVLLSDRYAWSDESGKSEATKDSVKLQSRTWQWISEWQIDHSTPGGVDKNGWQFSKDFKGPFRGRQRLRSYVRRRRWIRKCKVTTTGPWEEVGPLGLQDISIQIDPPEGEDENIAVWAIGTNGDILVRLGVTANNPKGDSWVHVPTDQPFNSITIGGDLHVWATAKDGSAWFRAGISPQLPTGECWYQVPPPSNRGGLLKQISAGRSQVWATCTNKLLYVRSNTSSRRPEGDAWIQVCAHVTHVSVGPKDQVWALVDEVPTKMGPVNGVIARRVAICDKDLRLGSWDFGVGGGWHHVCARSWLK